MRVLIVSLRLPRMHEPVRTKAGRLAPIARQVRSLRALGVDVDVLEITGMRCLKYFTAILKLWKLAGNYDLVHAHYGFCGWVARAQLACPIVVSFMGSDVLLGKGHTGRIPGRKKLEVFSNRLLARITNAVIVKSPEMARVVAPAQANVVPNGVDFDEFRPMPLLQARAALGWDPCKHYILFPANPAAPGRHTTAQARTSPALRKDYA